MGMVVYSWETHLTSPRPDFVSVSNHQNLRQEDGFLAKDYQLCWCQPADGRFGGPVIACDEPQHFLAHIATVAGPEGWVKWRGHGVS